jgi:hypothetical protein
MKHIYSWQQLKWVSLLHQLLTKKNRRYRGQAARNKQLLRNSAPPITTEDIAKADVDLLCKQLQF